MLLFPSIASLVLTKMIQEHCLQCFKCPSLFLLFPTSPVFRTPFPPLSPYSQCVLLFCFFQKPNFPDVRFPGACRPQSPPTRIKSLVIKFLAFGIGLKRQFLVKIFIMSLKLYHIGDCLLKAVNRELKSYFHPYKHVTLVNHIRALIPSFLFMK